jgi:GTP-binding protein Era
MSDAVNSRAGFVAIIGAPNAGKSTLVNTLVGEKVSIVTHKVQTTRFQVRGIAMLKDADDVDTQIVLVDTPGIFKAGGDDRLGRSMVHAAWSGVSDSDATVHMIDAPAYLRVLEKKPQAQDKRAFADTERVTAGLVKREEKMAFLALNKIDEIAHERLLEIIAIFKKMNIYREIFLISALNLDGVDALKLRLAETMPRGPFLFSPDQAADIPSRLMAAEITREKLYLRLHDELPYASTVETEKWTNQKNGDLRIDQIIYVKRTSQKPIVLGKGGRTIRDIGAAARQDMQDWLGRKVHLFLFVKVREGWHDDRARYADNGLEFDV